MRRGRTHRLSPERAERLRRALDRLERVSPPRRRLPLDPVSLPHRYRDPRDIEVAGLLAASLAYGRADLFLPKVSRLLEAMGRSPAAFVRRLDVAGARGLLSGFVYRFNVGADVAVLLLGMGRMLERRGSLEAGFVAAREASGGDLHGALGAFVRELREVDVRAVERALGKTRGLDHLLPVPLGQGAAKRLHLFLRWMVRGPDAVDLGIWKRVPPSALLVPLDTHVARLAWRLGLVRRRTMGWAASEDITENLRVIDPVDPVRFDFVLCHHGMSGACPPRARAELCAACVLQGECAVGRRLVARGDSGPAAT
ncbi:MAG TPA: TIGR02757 family protein [Myxococcaceae bacterium]|nr:TIGR02757 family protein [Myxococcaceae bacterium]